MRLLTENGSEQGRRVAATHGKSMLAVFGEQLRTGDPVGRIAKLGQSQEMTIETPPVPAGQVKSGQDAGLVADGIVNRLGQGVQLASASITQLAAGVKELGCLAPVGPTFATDDLPKTGAGLGRSTLTGPGEQVPSPGAGAADLGMIAVEQAKRCASRQIVLPAGRFKQHDPSLEIPVGPGLLSQGLAQLGARRNPAVLTIVFGRALGVAPSQLALRPSPGAGSSPQSEKHEERTQHRQLSPLQAVRALREHGANRIIAQSLGDDIVNPHERAARLASGWRMRVLGLLLGIGLQACAYARYEPTIPMRARSGDVELRLKFVRVGPAREFVFEAHSTAVHSIQRGWLTVGTRRPCTAGAEADEIVVDDNGATPGFLADGRHEVWVRFDGRTDDLSLDLVLDLELENGLCARTPVISQSIPLEAKKRPIVVGAMSLDGTDDLSGLRAILGGQVGGGGWLGPVLLTGQVGLGTSICSKAACGKDDNGNLKSGLAIPLAISAQVSFGQAMWNRLLSVGLLGARYSYVPFRLPRLDGDRWFAVHGFYGVIGWGFADRTKVPLVHAERTPLYEVAIPIGILVEPDAPAQRVAFAAGLDLRFLLPL